MAEDRGDVWTLGDMIEQCLEDSDRWFPETSGDITFLVLAMMGEAGEAANLVKKVWRESHTWEQVDDALKEEIVDVLIYLCNLMGALRMDPFEIYNKKRAYNVSRFQEPADQRAEQDAE